MQEIWKKIPGYSKYEVSNLGNLRNEERLLTNLVNVHGYVCNQLRSDDGKLKGLRRHRLIALVFIENPENKPTVNHINGIKHDNRLDNLEWSTGSEQNYHAIENNLIEHQRGSKHHMSKLSEEQAMEIYRLSNNGASGRDLAKQYNVSPMTISNIKNKVVWKHLHANFNNEKA